MLEIEKSQFTHPFLTASYEAVLGMAFRQGTFRPISSICAVFRHVLVLHKSRYLELYQSTFWQVWTCLDKFGTYIRIDVFSLK